LKFGASKPPMQAGFLREYVISVCISLAFMLILGLIAFRDEARLGSLNVAFAPGLFLAALAFPQGAHSESPYMYLGLG
jgi:hypothetical protein